MLVKGISESPQTTQGIVIAFGWPPELDGMTFLLEMWHTLVIGNEIIKPGIDQEHTSLLVSFYSAVRFCVGL